MVTKNLAGFYPPDMDKAGGFDAWAKQWSTGPHAEDDWVWFDDGDFTEAEAREILSSRASRKV